MFSRIVRHTPRWRVLINYSSQNLWNGSYRMIRTAAVQFSKQPTAEEFLKEVPTYFIFPELSPESAPENEFNTVVRNGEIPFEKLTAEKIVKASGRLSIEFEHFIDELSTNLRREFADQDVSNAMLNEFILKMEKHLLPLSYNLNLLRSFRLIRPNEFDFSSFEKFFSLRYAKSRLRFTDRQIYCFMCEMKARREFFGNTDANSNDGVSFEQLQKDQIVDRYIREAKLSGQSLKHQDQMRVYKLINEKLFKEQSTYFNRKTEETARFKASIISPRFLDILPDHVITNLNHNDAESVFHSFMRYCPDQNLRKDFWYAYHGLATLPGDLNSEAFRSIGTILDFRYRKAKMLDYENFAEMSLSLRVAGGETMAGSVENVQAFINGLAVHSEKRYNENLKELEDFATTKPKGSTISVPKNFVDKIYLWDLKYFERLFLREKYKVHSPEVRAHFPLNRAFSGMLNFAENLFDLKIVEQKDADNKAIGWGPNTRFFKVFSNNSKSMAELGSFYFDPFQSQSSIFMPVSRCDSLETKPLAFFLMNFSSGASIFDQYEKNQQLRAPAKETLLNFSQVVDLFAKFAFVLQHILTEVKYSEINSLSNVEADAFNLVSQFMSLWPLNSYEVIKNCSGHFETGEPIPEELYERIRKSYYHFASIKLRNDLYLMALDLNLHTSRTHAKTVEKKTWEELMKPFEWVGENGTLAETTDIFGGSGSESILYSKKWAEVIAADVFDAFREGPTTGLKSDEQIKQLGQRFRETFLANTGAISTNELFRRFRGRDPTLDGYLSINNLD